MNHWAASVAYRHSIPFITHPRGMLEPWAINHKMWKKRLALILYQQRDLRTANVLVATAESEGESLRALGFRQPIAVIPNGVCTNEFLDENEPNLAQIGGQRKVLFLSRIQGKKGLLNLIQAWAEIERQGWILQIAGPNEEGHLEKVLGLADQLGVASSVQYLGAVYGSDRVKVYKNAHLFVLPTYSENFGVVVAEALLSGLPVITTKGAPWADLETFGCGLWIDIGVKPLVTALRTAMTLSDKERKVMGERGRNYVRRFNWDDIAMQMVDVYRWVLDYGTKPDCIRLD